jgi:hypothetical protein
MNIIVHRSVGSRLCQEMMAKGGLRSLLSRERDVPATLVLMYVRVGADFLLLSKCLAFIVGCIELEHFFCYLSLHALDCFEEMPHSNLRKAANIRVLIA